MLIDGGVEMPLPAVDDCEVVGIALDIGLSLPGAMGAVPLSSQEIMAWSEGMAEPLSPWEFRALRAMSRAYVSGAHSDQPPYEPKQTLGAVTSAEIAVKRRIAERQAEVEAMLDGMAHS